MKDATLKELRRCSLTTKQLQLVQSCKEPLESFFETQGLKASPGLKLANAFSVISWSPAPRVYSLGAPSNN